MLKALEDLGYYSVDNLPIDLIPKFAELTKDAPNIRRAALVVDIREGTALEQLPGAVQAHPPHVPTRLLFLEADDASLIRRFSETRRPHPLGTEQSVGGQHPARARAPGADPRAGRSDHQHHASSTCMSCARPSTRLFAAQKESTGILVQVTSFGYRHGVPADSDLVFDVRFLPNPNYIPAFKNLTGKHPSVARYIRSFPQTTEFIERISDLLIYLAAALHRGREELSDHLVRLHRRAPSQRDDRRARFASAWRQAGYRVKETHRDVTKKI